jgi:hypothetical protein
MCTGAESMQMAGQAAGGYSRMVQGKSQQSLANADALYEKDAAQQQAEKILRAGAKQKSAARAATGASGARIDEFSMGAEQEIDALAGEDAAMTILSGDRRARSLRFSGESAARAGRNDFKTSLFKTANDGYSNWKGAKTTNQGWDWSGGRGGEVS